MVSECQYLTAVPAGITAQIQFLLVCCSKTIMKHLFRKAVRVASPRFVVLLQLSLCLSSLGHDFFAEHPFTPKQTGCSVYLDLQTLLYKLDCQCAVWERQNMFSQMKPRRRGCYGCQIFQQMYMDCVSLMCHLPFLHRCNTQSKFKLANRGKVSVEALIGQKHSCW